jgi:hypothetical protein
VDSEVLFEYLVVPEEENKEVKGLVATAAVAVEENQGAEGLAAAVAAVEENQGAEGLAAAVAVVEENQGAEGLEAVAAVVENGHPELITGFAGVAAAKRGRCKGFCGKPETEDITEIASRALRFVGNFANALDAALPIAAPRLLGFANISPMVLGLSFVVLMV